MSIQWSLVLFTALTGLAGWLFACVLISEWTNRAERTRFIAMLSGLVLMAVGGFASVLHLSHPENMLAALSHPTSGIFIEAVLVGISALCAIVYLVLHARKVSDTVRKVFLVISAIAGVALSFMAGSSYMMSSCPGVGYPLAASRVSGNRFGDGLPCLPRARRCSRFERRCVLFRESRSCRIARRGCACGAVRFHGPRGS